MSPPRVSVVVPTMGRRATLKRALRSVFRQSVADLEVVLVDDASPPEVAPLAEEFDDPRLRIIRRSVNGGPGAARNTGIAAARGDVIAFLDSDDEWVPTKLEEQLAYIDGRNPEDAPCDAVVCGYVMRFPDDGRRHVDDVRTPEPIRETARLVWGCDVSPGSTLLFRRAIVDDIGWFDESLRRMEDWDWLIRVSRRYRVECLREPLAIVHVSARASYRAVGTACEKLWDKHHATFAAYSLPMRLRFASSIALELSAAAVSSRLYGRGVAFGVLCLLLWPWRAWNFYFRLLRRLFARRSLTLHPVSRPRVMHVITGLGMGGAERMLANLVQGADGASQHVVVSLQSGGVYREEIEAAGVPVHDCGMIGLRSLLPGLLRLRRLMRRERPDIVKTWMYHANLMGLVALWLSGNRRMTRLFWGIRCSDMNLPDYPLQLRIVLWLNKVLSVAPEMIIGNSYAGRDVHIAAGFRDSAFAVMANGFDTDRFRPRPDRRAAVRDALALDPDAFVVAIVARTDPMKDYPLLLSALEEMPQVTCIAIGSGTDKLDGPPNFKALGPRKDVPDLLQAADALVSTSAFGEGMSNSIGEAMATGLPVVATDVGDSKALVRDGGLVIRNRDKAAFVAAVERLRADPDLRRNLGEIARARIETVYSLRHCRRAFDRLFLTAQLPHGEDRATEFEDATGQPDGMTSIGKPMGTKGV